MKYIVDALRSVEDVQQLEEILSCTKKLADDIGLPSHLSLSLSLCPSDLSLLSFVAVTQVQIDCLEKFVPIIEYLVENVENAHLLIKEYLYQSIIQTIGHPNNRVCVPSSLLSSSLRRLSFPPVVDPQGQPKRLDSSVRVRSNPFGRSRRDINSFPLSTRSIV